MIIKNVKAYMENQEFQDGTIYIKDGKFYNFVPSEDRHKDGQPVIDNCESNCDGEIIDGRGCYAVPGLIDLHLHGCKGYDVCDGTKEAFTKIAEYELSAGITAFAPATMTLPVNELEQILLTAYKYKKETEEEEKVTGADLVGINMEGPFISHEKKGAQDERNIILCDEEVCRRFIKASGGLVKFIGIAPEKNSNYIEFIQNIKDETNISLAHTNADYETAKKAFDAGANHAVHLYNAMPAFTHREPGVVGAVSDSQHVMAELICDGVHVHPSVARATLKMLGKDRVIFISDSMRATGMPDGSYTLGGLDVNVSGNRAVLASDGVLAGSVTNLMDCLRTAVKQMGIPLETAVACASANPAKSLGIYDMYGSVTTGKKADVVLLDKELRLELVIKDGRKVIQER